MSDESLWQLAERAGVARRWRDYRGATHEVAPPTLRGILRSIGLDADSEVAIEDSLALLASEERALPPLLTATVNQSLAIEGTWRVALEDGGTIEGRDTITLDTPGYHRIETGRGEAVLAAAPAACRPVPPGSWGAAVQLYSLRREGDGGLGDFAGLRDLIHALARHGADAVAISPVHAQFSADPDRFGPYAPSSRIMLNVLHAESPQPDPLLEARELVDWPTAARGRLAAFRARFDAEGQTDALAAFRHELGDPLETHARFEALHAHFFGEDPGLWHWRAWPSGFDEPHGAAVQRFAAEHPAEIAFHAWLQWQADRGLATANAAAKAMRIGLIADLAVGTDGGGSQAWSRQSQMLSGLSIGAPPDLLSPEGQDWGLTAFSPRGLRANGYGAFLELLRASLRHAGGLRIDHAMGLQRLWVKPQESGPGEGSYLSFPVEDMLRLVALESHRHDAVILGEDLGTLPDGFLERLGDTGVRGMRVMWFERDPSGFHAPSIWSRHAAAMTSTHDLPTVAGWWLGRDLEWRTRLGFIDPHQVGAEHAARAVDRTRLWQAMQASGAANGDEPVVPGPVVDAASLHVARSACELALIPMEDLLGREEQPNLPGTLHEHPNWQRRLPGPAADLLEAPEVAARLAAIRAARG